MFRRISSLLNWNNRLGKINLKLARNFTNKNQDAYLPRHEIFHNGEKVKPTFSAQEMQNRLDKLRKHMEKEQLDACVFTSYHNINYYSDFLYCYFGRPYAFIVTMDKAISVSAGKQLYHSSYNTVEPVLIAHLGK